MDRRRLRVFFETYKLLSDAEVVMSRIRGREGRSPARE